MFGVPKEYFQDVEIMLCASNDLIAETKVSKGRIINVFPEFTEEIPAIFFRLRLRGDLANPSVIAKQFAVSLTKALETHVGYPGPEVVILDCDSI